MDLRLALGQAQVLPLQVVDGVNLLLDLIDLGARICGALLDRRPILIDIAQNILWAFLLHDLALAVALLSFLLFFLVCIQLLCHLVNEQLLLSKVELADDGGASIGEEAGSNIDLIRELDTIDHAKLVALMLSLQVFGSLNFNELLLLLECNEDAAVLGLLAFFVVAALQLRCSSLSYLVDAVSLLDD